MNRETLLALLASAMSQPWAMRKEALDAARAALASLPGLGLNAGGGELLIPRAMRRFRAYDVVDPDPDKESDPPKTEEDDDEDDDLDPDPDKEDDDEDEPSARAPLAAVHPATERATARKVGSVALIPVRGTISNRMSIFDYLFGGGCTSPAWLVRAVTRAVNDDGIKAIVLDFDSPGGVVTGVQEAASAIFALRGKKPIVSQVSGQCASAAYWLACAPDEIVATPTALVGSIGVYMLHQDWSKFYEELGVAMTYVQAGEYKTEGSDNLPLSQEALAHLQEMVDDYMSMFTGFVAKGRGVAASVVSGETFGQGRVYTADRALGRGMIDKVRDVNATLAAYGVDPNLPEPEARRGRGLALLRQEVEALDL